MRNALANLTPKIAVQIVEAGGPTFRNSGRGFRVVQAPELGKLAQYQTESFRTAVFSKVHRNLATGTLEERKPVEKYPEYSRGRDSWYY